MPGRLLATIVLFMGMSACAPVGSSGGSDDNTENSENSVTPYEPPIPRPESADNLVVCAGSNKVNGIDVSKWQGNIKWPQVNKQFAFIKATEGNDYISAEFKSDWKEAKAAGIIRGAYHFFRPTDDPVAQANLFLQTMGPLLESDMPAVLDWEVNDGVSAATQIKKAKVWLQMVEEATGKIPILYTGPHFWNKLGNPEEFIRYPLFIAHYDQACPDVPPPWSTFTFWQHSDSGSVGGITGDVDLDIFKGTLDTLVKFARRGY